MRIEVQMALMWAWHHARKSVDVKSVNDKHCVGKDSRLAKSQARVKSCSRSFKASVGR